MLKTLLTLASIAFVASSTQVSAATVPEVEFQKKYLEPMRPHNQNFEHHGLFRRGMMGGMQSQYGIGGGFGKGIGGGYGGMYGGGYGGGFYYDD
jgi:hypothetical protein